MNAVPLDPEVCALYLAYSCANDGSDSDLFLQACRRIQSAPDAFAMDLEAALDELEEAVRNGEISHPTPTSLRPLRTDHVATVRAHALRVPA